MSTVTEIPVTFTVAEAKAVARLLRAGLEEIAADRTSVSNEKTLTRAVQRAGAGCQKIEAALLAAGTPLPPLAL